MTQKGKTRKFRGSQQTKAKKNLMIEKMKKHLGIVTTACKSAGIERKSHYNWLKSDEVYKEEIEAIPERTHDFVENKLLQKIKNGDTTATIFYLKTKAKSRGYSERQEIEHSTPKGKGFNIKIIDPNYEGNTNQSINERPKEQYE